MSLCKIEEFPQVRDLLRLGIMPSDDPRARFVNHTFRRGWWTSQFMLLLLNPNPKFLQFMRKNLNPYLPLPHPVVALHVRHGDKYKEMKLHPFSEYLVAVQQIALRANTNITYAFVSTEDGGVIDECVAQNQKPYQFLYTVNHSRFNSGPLQAIGRHGCLEEIRIAFMNLFLCLESDFFVWTRGSNWSRLIDELRNMTGSCGAHTVDLEPADHLDAC